MVGGIVHSNEAGVLSQRVQVPGRVIVAGQVLTEKPAEACPTMIGQGRGPFQAW